MAPDLRHSVHRSLTVAALIRTNRSLTVAALIRIGLAAN